MMTQVKQQKLTKSIFAVVVVVAFVAVAKCNECQRITIPMCVGIGYNHTHMPNSFNHDTQVCYA